MKADARFEVLKAVSMKKEVYRNVKQCRLVNNYSRFGRERPLLFDCPPTRRYIFTSQHGITSQKARNFMRNYGILNLEEETRIYTI